MKLSGKICVVTGASSGIGAAVAKLFAGNGADVIITSNTNKAAGDAVLAEITRLNKSGKHMHLCLDLSDRARVVEAFSQIKKSYGRVDVLVNNAGVAMPSNIDTITPENFDTEFGVNLKSAIWVTQCAKKLIAKGHIINTSSIRGLPEHGRAMTYAMTKAAMNSLTKTLAKNLAPNILVNAVLPGFTWTPPYEKNPKELNDGFLKTVRLNRFLAPEELAECYLFLATQTCVTGHLLVADGGSTLGDF